MDGQNKSALSAATEQDASITQKLQNKDITSPHKTQALSLDSLIYVAQEMETLAMEQERLSSLLSLLSEHLWAEGVPIPGDDVSAAICLVGRMNMFAALADVSDSLSNKVEEKIRALADQLYSDMWAYRAQEDTQEVKGAAI